MQAQDTRAYRTPDLFTHKPKRGGYRGGGRKKEYGEPTKAMKVPVSRVEEVKAYLKGELQSADRQMLEHINTLMKHWQEKAEPYKERPRVKQGHFRAACDLLKELQAVLESADNAHETERGHDGC